MMKYEDFLIEIHTEELPPKALLKLAESFWADVKARLKKADLASDDMIFFATPRRLALLIKGLVPSQPDQTIERKGPAIRAAFDADGNPTEACIGFARSLGVTPKELSTIKQEQGEWVGLRQTLPGKSVAELMPSIIEQATAQLPIPKRMRWGNGDTQFVRPVHSIVMLYGDEVIPATILGCKTDRLTHGHRFLSRGMISIPTASSYPKLLKEEGFVIANFAERRATILNQINEYVEKNLGAHHHALVSNEDFMNEVTGLVEWPVVLCGQFDESFLTLPKEVLISSMKDHQRYFPVVDDEGKLKANFITISNIESHDKHRIIHGNERVLRARLSDAAFFYEIDKKESLEKRIERLKGIVFQAKLGTLYEKAERLSHIAFFVADKMGVNKEHAKRAGWLAKTDLTTNMVGEFPELQGSMGYYYGINDGEPKDIAIALKEQYMPRFAGDALPKNSLGTVLAIADRIDMLTGAFGINQIPTGDKDPYGLRRASVGLLRLLIENKINLDLKEVFEFAIAYYAGRLENAETIPQLLNFIQERLRAFYLDQGVTADVFASVAALHIANPLDVDERIKAVSAFKKLSEAETLSIANKRVSNILSKYVDTIDAKAINPAYFEHSAEQELARQLEAKSALVSGLYASGNYAEVLLQLATLRQPIDDFFDQVMVMTDDKAKRENRILLLSKLRALFLQVADIALLQ